MAVQRAVFADHRETLSEYIVRPIDGYFEPLCSYFAKRKIEVISSQAHESTGAKINSKGFFLSLKTTLKVITYFSGVIPLFLLIVKISLRILDARPVTRTRKIEEATSVTIGILKKRRQREEKLRIDAAQHSLEEGLEIPREAIETIQRFMLDILGHKSNAEIEWIGTNTTRVFSLKSAPRLVFKTTSDPDIIMRWDNMIKAQATRNRHNLDLLIIPHAKKFTVNEITLIAEERIDFRGDEDLQEELFMTLPTGLDETVDQLARFIAETGFSDVTWRNIPIIDDAPEFTGQRRIALIDFERMNESNIGFFGGWPGRIGLINCLFTERHIDIALTVAGNYQILPMSSPSRQISPLDIKEHRIKMIKTTRETYVKLQQFYIEKGISEKNPREHIQVADLASLGLNLKETATIGDYSRAEEPGMLSRSITLHEAICYVIDQINLAIDQNPESSSIKRKRSIQLSFPSFGILYSLQNCCVNYTDGTTWLSRIVNALKQKGHIFKILSANGCEYSIQA